MTLWRFRVLSERGNETRWQNIDVDVFGSKEIFGKDTTKTSLIVSQVHVSVGTFDYLLLQFYMSPDRMAKQWNSIHGMFLRSSIVADWKFGCALYQSHINYKSSFEVCRKSCKASSSSSQSLGSRSSRGSFKQEIISVDETPCRSFGVSSVASLPGWRDWEIRWYFWWKKSG